MDKLEILKYRLGLMTELPFYKHWTDKGKYDGEFYLTAFSHEQFIRNLDNCLSITDDLLQARTQPKQAETATPEVDEAGSGPQEK